MEELGLNMPRFRRSATKEDQQQKKKGIMKERLKACSIEIGLSTSRDLRRLLLASRFV